VLTKRGRRILSFALVLTPVAFPYSRSFSSYGTGTTSSGAVQLVLDLKVCPCLGHVSVHTSNLSAHAKVRAAPNHGPFREEAGLPQMDIEGRDVLVVEDILDTGTAPN
jgi:hypothetical protein